jgi:putative DNA primase/helicase
MPLDRAVVMDAARGNWPAILVYFGVPERCVQIKKPSDCPICQAGEDRFTFDDQGGNGNYICRKCEGRKAGDGLWLVSKVCSWGAPEAIHRVGTYLGLESLAPPGVNGAAVRRKPLPRPKPRDDENDTRRPIVPIPKGSPDPTFEHARHAKEDRGEYWVHYGASGRAEFLAVQFKGADGAKVVLPLTWCTGRAFRNKKPRPDGWEWLAPKAPRALYGTQNLAKLPGVPVLLVEGDRCAREAQKALGSAFAVVSWWGGVNAWQSCDWKSLAGRDVILWPDADPQGWDCMFGKITRGPGPDDVEETPGLWDALASIGAEMSYVLPPPGVAEGWDVADALVLDGWSPEKLAAWITEERSTDLEDGVDREVIIEAEPEAEPVHEVEETGPGDMDDDDDGAGDELPPDQKRETISNNDYYQLIGFDEQVYYVLSKTARQVMRFTSQKLGSSAGVAEIMPLNIWQRTPRYVGEKGGIKYSEIASDLIEASRRVGVYNPDLERGRRGAWLDAGRHVFHLGDKLWVDGETKDIDEHPSRYVYNQGSKLPRPSKVPIDDATRASLVRALELVRWEHEASAPLLLGWLVLAPICGMLSWRPHVWLTGARGTGKSWLMTDIIDPIVGEIGIYCEQGTSEAGVRQQVRRDARAVIYDEAEPTNEKQKGIIEGVITLARSASSESNRVIIKGSAGHAAVSFHVRSMFLFGSITPHVDRAQDVSRITLLGLRPEGVGADNWPELKVAASAITPKTGQQLLALTLANIKDVLANVETFREAATQTIGKGSQRIGDQFGTMLGAAWWVRNLGRATEDEAAAFCNSYNFYGHVATSEEKDEDQLLSFLLQTAVRVEVGHSSVTATLGELARLVAEPEDPIEPGPIKQRAARKALGRNGIRVMPNEGEIWIANSGKELSRILAHTGWSTNWNRILQRMEGAAPAKDSKVIWFGDGLTSRGTAVPLAFLMEGNEADEEF